MAQCQPEKMATHTPIPDQTAQPDLTPTPPTSTTGVTGAHYRSPTWGFELSWDDTLWKPDPVEMIGADQPDLGIADLDQLHLHGQGEGQSGVHLHLGAYRGAVGDAQQCLDTYTTLFSTDPNTTGFAPGLDGQGQPIAGMTDDGVAYSVHTFQSSEIMGAPEEGNMVAYLECRTLVPETAVFYVVFLVPEVIYNETLASALAVIETLETPPPALIDPHAGVSGPSGPSGSSGPTA
jgi:hypothetical protein